MNPTVPAPVLDFLLPFETGELGTGVKAVRKSGDCGGGSVNAIAAVEVGALPPALVDADAPDDDVGLSVPTPDGDPYGGVGADFVSTNQRLVGVEGADPLLPPLLPLKPAPVRVPTRTITGSFAGRGGNMSLTVTPPHARSSNATERRNSANS